MGSGAFLWAWISPPAPQWDPCSSQFLQVQGGVTRRALGTHSFRKGVDFQLQSRLRRFREINIQSSNLSTDGEVETQGARAVPKIPWDTVEMGINELDLLQKPLQRETSRTNTLFFPPSQVHPQSKCRLSWELNICPEATGTGFGRRHVFYLHFRALEPWGDFKRQFCSGYPYLVATSPMPALLPPGVCAEVPRSERKALEGGKTPQHHF